MDDKKLKILIFGGTTEGRNTAWLLDQVKEPYLYSTKTETSTNLKGEHITGPLTKKAIIELCRNRQIKLIIDAGHPFAEELHANILKASEKLAIETIRFERNYTDISGFNNIRLFPDFKSMELEILKSGYDNILALTGVNTINRLKKVWLVKRCFFRILPQAGSKHISGKSGIPSDYILEAKPEKDEQSFLKLIEKTNAQLVLSKESGESGFFNEKALATQNAGIPLWVVSRPRFNGYSHMVNSLPELQSLIYKLRKTVLKDGEILLSGYTTGSCVTAAAKAALVSLLDDKIPETIEIDLPTGDSTTFVTYCKRISETESICKVVKDAGDDPDITHGEEIGCRVRKTNKAGIQIIGGKGIGKVTLPGLPIKIGEPAINPVPGEMLYNALSQVSEIYEYEYGLIAEPFVPKGEELAKKTFNPRVGVVGGISILGTSGKVKPYSNEAFLSSIKEHLQVVKALNCNQVALISGLRSEKKIKPLLPGLPEQAFVHFGNQVGNTLKICDSLGFKSIYIGLMPGKALKLAEGHLDTHSKKATLNVKFAAQLAKDSGYSMEIVQQIAQVHLASNIPEIIPFNNREPYYQLIKEKCTQVCKKSVRKDTEIEFYLL